MSTNTTVLIYILAMIVTVVAVDLLFFRHRFLERFLANIGIVLVYVAFYLAFLNKH